MFRRELGEVHVGYVKDKSFECEIGAARFDDECDSFEDALTRRKIEYISAITLPRIEMGI